jgi:tRNA(fMet)-specific endonuclease VapC
VATLYLLDTNILLAYVRGGSLYTFVETKYALWTMTPAPLVSVVSEGEIRALAEEFAWGTGKRRLMEHLLARFTIIPLPFANVIDAYVQVSEYCRRAGRVLGKNDLWIAATAMATGATLLTTDKDFDPLDPALLPREWIDPTLP